MSDTFLAETTARFLNPSFLALFKGFTLTTVAPIVIIVILTVLAVNIIASLLADSPGPYPQFGKRLATAAADIWDNRNQYGFLNGRTLDTLGPLENILDAISESVKKWEDAPLYNTSGSGLKSYNEQATNNNYLQQEPSASAPIPAYYQSSPQFVSNAEAKSSKVRFQ